MDNDIKKNINQTINRTIEALKTYEARERDKLLRQHRITALVNAIDAANNYLIEKGLLSQEFLFGAEGIKLLTFTEDGSYDISDSYIAEYDDYLHMSEDEIGYTLDIIQSEHSEYPASNFRFGYHHFGHSLMISINI